MMRKRIGLLLSAVLLLCLLVACKDSQKEEITMPAEGSTVESTLAESISTDNAPAEDAASEESTAAETAAGDTAATEPDSETAASEGTTAEETTTRVDGFTPNPDGSIDLPDIPLGA